MQLGPRRIGRKAMTAADVERVAIAIRGAMRIGATMSEIAAAAMRETRLIDAEWLLANGGTEGRHYADWLEGRADADAQPRHDHLGGTTGTF